MNQTFVSHGRMLDSHTIALDEDLPLASTRIRVTLEVLDAEEELEPEFSWDDPEWTDTNETPRVQEYHVSGEEVLRRDREMELGLVEPITHEELLLLC